MTIINPHKISELIADASHEIILPRFKKLQKHEILSKKKPNDLVTLADLEMEAHLKKTLPDFLPGAIVIGEEGVSKGEDSLEVLKDTSQKIFMIDPIDGTRNFVNGNETFGVMIACIISGKTVLSWIYDVMKNSFFIAEKSSGAFQDDKRLKTNTTVTINDAIAHANMRYFSKAMKSPMGSFMTNFKETRTLGSSAHEYTHIAKGHADISFYSKSRIWDMLPGVLLTEEAGGYVRKPDKTPLHVHEDMTHVIAAANKDLWQESHAQLSNIKTLKPYIA